MPLNLYRRHRRECKANHPEDSLSGEFEERKKSWKRCDCPIFVSGTLDRTFRRKSTGHWEWDAARNNIAQFELAWSWTGTIAPPPPPEATPPPPITIERAVTSFLAEKEDASARNTLRKHRTILKKLTDFSLLRGYTSPGQWTPIDIREFRSSWDVASNTAANNMVIIKTFFGYCVANKWIAENPASLVRNPRAKETATERTPFSDEELSRMFTACDTAYGKSAVKWSRTTHHHPAIAELANYRYKWTGRDLSDFISISIYTGLRISDVSTFHVGRLLSSGECHVRTTKTGRKVFTWIPDWLQDRIKQRADIHGPFIFGARKTTDVNVITDTWRRKLNKLWSLCGPWSEKPTPHRFRHTFARILLQKPGVTVRDVAELMGDTEEMVLRHYSAWMPERQERLTQVLREAFADKPKPEAKVVAIR